MKIVHITPGSGGTFYCQNCVRDFELVEALRALGHDVKIVPLYLPVLSDGTVIEGDSPVFYGAINVYLKQTIPFFRKAPPWIEKSLDSPCLLRWAAGKAEATRARGQEKLTLSMLNGENGSQASELEKLVQWLGDNRPDIVHLSNALLLGLAPRITSELNVPVVCSLHGEDIWINAMDEEYRSVVWNTMAEKAQSIEAFVAVSDYYANAMRKHLKIPDDRMHVVHVGINLDGYEVAPSAPDPPVIGYLSRMAESLGLGLLVEAFIKLKQNKRLKNVKLRIAGGRTGDDNRFINTLRRRLALRGLTEDVEFLSKFDRNTRLEFLKSLTVLSVPVPGGEAFGAYLIESMAAGVPVVQPKQGAFPEVIAETGGGILYGPNDADSLAEALSSLLLDPERAEELGKRGRDSVFDRFSIETTARNMIKVYESVTVSDSLSSSPSAADPGRFY